MVPSSQDTLTKYLQYKWSHCANEQLCWVTQWCRPLKIHWQSIYNTNGRTVLMNSCVEWRNGAVLSRYTDKVFTIQMNSCVEWRNGAVLSRYTDNVFTIQMNCCVEWRNGAVLSRYTDKVFTIQMRTSSLYASKTIVKHSCPALLCLNPPCKWTVKLSTVWDMHAMSNRWIDCPRWAETKASKVAVLSVKSYKERYSTNGCFLNRLRTIVTSQIELYLGKVGRFRATPFMNLITK